MYVKCHTLSVRTLSAPVFERVLGFLKQGGSVGLDTYHLSRKRKVNAEFILENSVKMKLEKPRRV